MTRKVMEGLTPPKLLVLHSSHSLSLFLSGLLQVIVSLRSTLHRLLLLYQFAWKLRTHLSPTAQTPPTLAAAPNESLLVFPGKHSPIRSGPGVTKLLQNKSWYILTNSVSAMTEYHNMIHQLMFIYCMKGDFMCVLSINNTAE